MPVTDALHPVFRRFGRAAIYRPAGGGSTVACTVLVDAADDLATLGQGSFVAGQRIIEVRASEVASPKKGEAFDVGAERFVLVGAPARRDADQLVWTCLCSSGPIP
jgi:hypothetical protein